MRLMKILDKYEYPEEIDMSEFMDDSSQKVTNRLIYCLVNRLTNKPFACLLG